MPKPNFSGHWQPNFDRSRLEIPRPTSSDFVIEHDEPNFRLTRTLVFGEHSSTISFELTTDGAEHEQDFEGRHARMRLKWDGAALLAHMIVRSGEEEGTNEVRYSLEDEGRTLVARERFQSTKLNYDNLWVFDRV
jgi:hypothetical protein